MGEGKSLTNFLKIIYRYEKERPRKKPSVGFPCLSPTQNIPKVCAIVLLCLSRSTRRYFCGLHSSRAFIILMRHASGFDIRVSVASTLIIGSFFQSVISKYAQEISPCRNSNERYVLPFQISYSVCQIYFY